MDEFLRILKQYWGYDSFRGIQPDIIKSIASGRDTLGLMPTGGGKSITFQIPALAKEGTCIVVTPLIALMKDQVHHLRQKGIRAAAIYSGMSRAEIVKTLDNCILGDMKLLYVSPERLSSELFLAKLRYLKVSFITVDEAHCISQWGYDFRPAYLHIADLRKIKPEAPVLALTATATPQVVDDIQERLLFKEKNVYRMSFNRSNLTYVVRYTDDKPAELIHILKLTTGSAIVYARSRRKCKELAVLLEQNGISATFYHAGLEHTTRDERQKQWQQDKKRVIVATNAFGMGIDKPNVRMVLHIDSPDSIEAYFQEAGRAGRDGQQAYAVLLWNRNDARTLHRRVEENFPPKEYVNDVYNHLAYFYQIGTGSGKGQTFSFDIGVFCSTYGYYPVTVDAALHLLDNAGYLHYETAPDSSARLLITLDRNELYRLEELNGTEEKVITAVLRLYGGLFTDYQHIEEAQIAMYCQLKQEEVYQVLRTLSTRHIVNFIPQRKKPFITWLRDREDDVYLSPSVYDERKEQYIKRIDAMVNYASNDKVCRSRQLLRYFGETESQDCGHCDVCRSNHHDINADKAATRLILDYLGDNKVHGISELRQLHADSKIIAKCLEALVHEESVHVKGDRIALKRIRD